MLITTDLDRTLIFSPRATSQLGGARPADVVEAGGSQPGELCHGARDAIRALPEHALMCLATSRSVFRLARLRLPFAVDYAIAANGGVLLIDGQPDPQWSAHVRGRLAGIARAATVRALLAGLAGSPWLERLGEEDDLCVLAIVDPEKLESDQLAAIGDRCAGLGWQASLIGRKLYAFRDHDVLPCPEQCGAVARVSDHLTASRSPACPATPAPLRSPGNGSTPARAEDQPRVTVAVTTAPGVRNRTPRPSRYSARTW